MPFYFWSTLVTFLRWKRYIARVLTLKIPKMQLQAFVQYDQLWYPKRLTQDLCRSYMMHLNKRMWYSKIWSFSKTLKKYAWFLLLNNTLQYPQKKTHTLTLCGNKSYRESQRRIQCLLLFEQHAGPLSVLDIISSFNYLQKRKTHISNSEEERNMHANRAAW